MKTPKKHIITIAGKPGSGKSTTAKLAAERLGFRHFSGGDMLREVGHEFGFELLQANLAAEEREPEIDRRVDGKLQELGEQEDRLVIDARTAWHWIPASFKVFLDLDLATSAERVIGSMTEERLQYEHVPHDPVKYAQILQERLGSEARRYKLKYGINAFDLSNFDLVVDTSAQGIDEVVGLVLESFGDWLDAN